MDYQSQPPRKNSFIAASVLMGILSLVSLCTVIGPMIFGSLGIIFAVLAHRKGEKPGSDELLGIITSSIGVGFSVILMIGALAMVPSMLNDPEYREYLNQMSEQMYGETFDEMLEEMNYE